MHKPATSGQGPQPRGWGQPADPVGSHGSQGRHDPVAPESYDRPGRSADPARSRRQDAPGSYGGPGRPGDARGSYGSGLSGRAGGSYGGDSSRRADGSYGNGSQPGARGSNGSYDHGSGTPGPSSRGSGPGARQGSSGDRGYGSAGRAAGPARTRGAVPGDGRQGRTRDPSDAYESPDPLGRPGGDRSSRTGGSRGPGRLSDPVTDPSGRYGLPARPAGSARGAGDPEGRNGRAGDPVGRNGRPGRNDRPGDPVGRNGRPGDAVGRDGRPDGPESRYGRPGEPGNGTPGRGAPGRGAPGQAGLAGRYGPADRPGSYGGSGRPGLANDRAGASSYGRSGRSGVVDDRAGAGSYGGPGRSGVADDRAAGAGSGRSGMADPYRDSGRPGVADPYGRPSRRRGGPYGPDGPDGPGGPDGPDGPDDGDGDRPGIGGHRARRPVKTRKNGKPRLRDRLWARILAGALAIFLVIVGWSVGHALTVPGGGSVSQRLAEWARGHYLGPLVTFGEWLAYSPPKKGGKPSFSLTGGPSASAAALQKKKRLAALYAPPAPLKPFVSHPVAGEGKWRVLAVVNNEPAIFGTYLRPSSVYSSYVAGIAEMNPALLKFYLHPGAEDPGPGLWHSPSYIPSGARRGLLATFNSGFKIDVSGGGFYLNGRTRGTLTKGTASVVYYKNGHIAIGNWDQGGLTMSPNVAAVRQNLHLIVQNGRIPASVNYNVTTQWGATLGGGYYVWRSGIGMTKTGRVIFVYGPALNVQELAALLQRAGAVTAMQLDINPDWMSYMYYLPKAHPNNPTPVNLLPDQMQPANRYFSLASRDFTAVYAR